MTDDPRQDSHECPPLPKDPADQPQPPGGTCVDLPTTTPPEIDDPKPCPKPDPPCKCPPPPGSTSNCLEDLIDSQTAQITVAEKAKAFKTELEAFLAKAKAAEQEYTRDKFDKLVKTWVEVDRDIADLIRKLVCAIPCWRCIIECYVCPRLNELHYAERWLYGDGIWYTAVHNLYDLRYWHDRDLARKQRTLQRIKDVLAAWEKPFQTIDKALGDNQKLLKDTGLLLGSDLPKAVYDVFLRLVPMHLAIAPPSGTPWKTRIGKEYTRFCACDTGTPDNCCGPDVGALSLRQRLVGPQPYLIDPNDYFKVICCLVEHRYSPAKDAAAAAEAAFQKADNDIKRRKAQVDNGLKSFEKDTKAAIPSAIKCCHDDDIEIQSQTS